VQRDLLRVVPATVEKLYMSGSGTAPLPTISTEYIDRFLRDLALLPKLTWLDVPYFEEDDDEEDEARVAVEEWAPDHGKLELCFIYINTDVVSEAGSAVASDEED
jgi:hypothetical protein